MSMTLDADALPDQPPPMADYAGVSMPSMPPSGMDAMAQAAPGVDLGALAAEAATIKRAEMADKARIQGEEDKKLEAHRAVMEQRFAQTGVNPEDFKPFDNEAAREKYKTNPIESFGSIGSVFAILASTFTNRPMENAMYGAAAAMNAIKAGNEQEYDRAYKTWQDNTNLAIKRQAAQHQSYSDATSMVTTDMSIAQDRMKQSALKYGDKRMLLLLEQGLWGDAIELATKQNDLGSKLADAQSNIMMEEAKQQIIRADPRFKSPDPAIKMQAVREINAAFSDKSRETPADAHSRLLLEQLRASGETDIVTKHREGMDKWYESTIGAGTRKLSEPQKAFKDDIQTKFGREPTHEEWIDFGQRSRATATKDSEFIKKRTIEIMVEQSGQGKNISETQAEKLAREELTRTRTNPAVTERLGSIEKAKADWLEKHPEANGVIPTEIENQIRANAHRSVTNATLDDRTARLMAEQVVAGRHQAMAGLGHGGIGTANRAKVIGMVTDIANERGLNGADIARQAIEYQATGRGASSLAQLEARTTGAITKAQATAPRVLEISDQIDRTRYPKINDVIIAAQKNLGGEKVVKLGIAVETFVLNYAMALGGGNSVITVSMQNHARELLERGYSKGQMHAAIDQMMIEMESELEGIKRGLSTYLEPPKKGGTPTFKPPSNWEENKALQQYRDPKFPDVIYDKNGKKIQ